MRKVHRGHWKEASGSDVLRAGLGCEAPGAVDPEPSLIWVPPRSDTGLGRTGRGAWSAAPPVCRPTAAEMAALRTWVRVGLMPHDRHGGSGVWALAVEGSKLEGTGFEKLQIVHTHVVALAGGGSTGGGRMGLSFRRPGDAVPLPGAKPGDRGPREDRLSAFGMRVTLADDLRNPACEISQSVGVGWVGKQRLKRSSPRGSVRVIPAKDVHRIRNARCL